MRKERNWKGRITRTRTKDKWGEGPWQHEPDKIQYKDKKTGLPCLIKRNRMGALCGYVGVDESHPWFGKGYEEIDVIVHGGLNYADECEAGPEEHSICHIPDPGEPDHVWWLGFDCSHGGDVVPALQYQLRDVEGFSWNDWPGSTYKTVEYVREENARLAAQVAEVAARLTGRSGRRNS